MDKANILNRELRDPQPFISLSYSGAPELSPIICKSPNGMGAIF